VVVLKTKVISIRLPEDHWIWQEQDKQAAVKLALNLYRQIGELNSKIDNIAREMDEIKGSIVEIKNKINSAAGVSSTIKQKDAEKPQLSGVDPRLARAVDRLLDI